MRVVVIGAGGHARSVIEALRTGEADLEPVACTDPNRSRRGHNVDGVPIVGGDEVLPELLRDGVGGACLGLGGVGDNGPRRRLFETVLRLGFALPSVRHGAAILAGNATLGDGSQALAGAIVGAGASIGADVIVNCGAVVEHDAVIADHVHLASGCVLAGAVRVAEEAHVGAGATILQGVSIGGRSIIGAGAVVIRDLAADQLAVGVPAIARPRP